MLGHERPALRRVRTPLGADGTLVRERQYVLRRPRAAAGVTSSTARSARGCNVTYGYDALGRPSGNRARIRPCSTGRRPGRSTPLGRLTIERDVRRQWRASSERHAGLRGSHDEHHRSAWTRASRESRTSAAGCAGSSIPRPAARRATTTIRSATSIASRMRAAPFRPASTTCAASARSGPMPMRGTWNLLAQLARRARAAGRTARASPSRDLRPAWAAMSRGPTLKARAPGRGARRRPRATSAGCRPNRALATPNRSATTTSAGSARATITTDQSYQYDYTYNSHGAVDTLTYPASPVPAGQSRQPVQDPLCLQLRRAVPDRRCHAGRRHARSGRLTQRTTSMRRPPRRWARARLAHVDATSRVDKRLPACRPATAGTRQQSAEPRLPMGRRRQPAAAARSEPEPHRDVHVRRARSRCTSID